MAPVHVLQDHISINQETARLAQMLVASAMIRPPAQSVCRTLVKEITVHAVVLLTLAGTQPLDPASL